MQISLKIILVAIVIVVLGFFVLNKQDGLIKNMNQPNKIEFAFRDIALEKNGDKITGTLVSPLFSDARGLDDGRESKEVKINKDEFYSLWNLISKIDFELYKNPSVENFIPAPTDVSTLERLKLIIDGDEVINKNYEQMLFGKILEPLEEIRNKAKTIIENK